MPPSKKRSAKKGDKQLKFAAQQEVAAGMEAQAERELLGNTTTTMWGEDGLRMVNAQEAQNELDRLREKKKTPEHTKLDDLCDLSIRAGQHAGLYLEAKTRFEFTEYWYDQFIEEDDPRRVAFNQLVEGYKHVANAWVELGDSHSCDRPYAHWTRLVFNDSDPDRYVLAIEEQARHMEEQAWRTMTFPVVADVFGEQAISDGRLVQMLCAFVLQTFLPEDLSVVTNCTSEEMIGMLQFAWKYLITLGRLVTFVDIRNVITNAAAYVAWSRCNGWRYTDGVWGSVGEWVSRLQYFSSSGATPSPKRSPNGMPTSALIDLVHQAKPMGKIGHDTSAWRKAIDPWLFVECTRRPDVIEFTKEHRVKLPLTTSSSPADLKVMLQAVGLRLQERDASEWFQDTPFEARWHVCVLNLAEPSLHLVNVLLGAITDWMGSCHGEMQRARQMYGNTVGCDADSVSALVPEWGYAIVDAARKASVAVEHVTAKTLVEGPVSVAPHIPRAFVEAHADALKEDHAQPMRFLSVATLTRPEERVAPVLLAQAASLLRRSRFANNLKEATETVSNDARSYAWKLGGPHAFRLTYCGAFFGLPSFGPPLPCEDLMFLTCTRDIGSDVRVDAMGKLVDEAVLVRPGHTFAKSGLVQRQVDLPRIGLWCENPAAFRTWIWECCMGIVELVYPRVEARNAKGMPFDSRRDTCLLRCIDDSVVHSFCLPLHSHGSAERLRDQIKAALRQSLIAVAARLIACRQIGERQKLNSTLDWKWPMVHDPWRIIKPVYSYEWPFRFSGSEDDALTASLVAAPHRMPKAIARMYIAMLERADSVGLHAAHKRVLSTWKRCMDAASDGSQYCEVAQDEDPST
jgi:hypothetical protein